MPTACRQPAVLALCLLLAACASDDKPKGPSPEQLLEQATAGGYAPAHHYGVREVHETWRQGETEIDITLLWPDPGNVDKWLPRPLVVYLPGLGESASEGSLWRRAWAQAGYAVLALQPREFGPQLWSSQRAFAGEFADIAQDAYAASTLKRRLQAVGFVLAQAQRRSATDKTGGWYIDYGRVVIAGFDYGAQAAAVAGGARVGGVPAEAAPALPGLDGLLLLSPYPGNTRNAARWDYSTVTLPALSVTGGRDGDPYDLLGRGASRSAPWNAMPPGDKYQLLLAKATHTLISGVGLVDPLTQGRAAVKKQRDDDQEKRREREQRKGSQNTENTAAAPPNDTAPVVPQVFDSGQVASILAVSTAFLDATLGHEAAARLWLQRDAPGWIGPVGRLETK